MKSVISIHEYYLIDGVTGEQFEAAVEAARRRGLFNLPGLVNYYFLKRIRGTKKVEYVAIWVYKDRKTWENLWGKADDPVEKENYPEQWIIWEDEVLAPLLAQDPDRIAHAAYDEF